MLFSNILKQGMVIAANRLLLLSMPFIDLVVLGDFSPKEIADFSLSSQYVQIIVILIVTSAIGINILVKADGRYKYTARASIGYVLLIAVISSLFLGLLSVSVFEEKVNTLNLIFILGMPFCALYVATSSILETIGYAKLILYLSVVAALSNILLDIVYVNYLYYFPSESVALSTTTVRIIQGVLALAFLFKKTGIKVTPIFSRFIYKKLFSFALSENITAVLFVGSISGLLYFISKSFDVDTLAYLGITLNFMNMVSMVFVSYCISFTIDYSQHRHNTVDIHNGYLIKTCLVFLSFSSVLMLFSDGISAMYMQNTPDLKLFLQVSLAVVLFDGISTYTISYLRVNGHKKIPPLLRLSFVFIGIPLGFYLSVSNGDGIYLVLGMLAGNVISFLLIQTYYRFVFKNVATVRRARPF